MSSRQSRKQARRNGAQAAGTKSPAEIQQSSRNSLKHGLTSSMIVLASESRPQFEELHQTYIETFHPANGVEMDLVDQMVASQWRLRRIWIMQTASLDLKMDHQEKEGAKNCEQIDPATRVTVAFTALANDEKSLGLLLRHETTYTRLYQRAINTLIRLRRENRREENLAEPITSRNLRNEPPPTEAEPEPGPKIILGSPEFVEMITRLKSHRDEFEPRPERME